MELLTITILGIDYKINCPSEKADSLHESAALLDDRLTKMRATGKMSIEQAAIMTGLNLADEFLQADRKLNRTRSELASQLDSLNHKIDQALVHKRS